ncbi:helix-turn-helix domain-containing protein [Edaphobacter dinghuensis]|uniref:helix-turn-helix domain-containing protein n=1 Tax=Edaphobacter dinghuensis TaxID=1560005 RepID=UPI00166B2883|nr:helix-turn-helix domain-containing protein [Edaphobacter dinghuensis]
MSPITEAKILTKYRARESRTDRARRLQPDLDREYIVPILLKSVQVLDLLGEVPGGMRIEQIHQETGIAKTTVYRIVRTLVVSGRLCHANNGAYAIARKLNAEFDSSSCSSDSLYRNQVEIA